MRLVFMGTPGEAVPSLRALKRCGEIVAVYTRPDRPRGRGQRMEPSEVKVAAGELGLRVIETSTLRKRARELADLRPDVVCVVAYGAILPADVLSVPREGCVNVHFSLLPRWRGAAPVERAILAGDTETGVVTMLMEEGLDTGPLLAVRKEPIKPDDTSGSLRERLSELGADLLLHTVSKLGELEPAPQDESVATYAEKVRPEEAELDPGEGAVVLERRVRAMNPSPGSFVRFRDRRLKVWKARVVAGTGDPGRFVDVDGESLEIQTAEDRLRLLEVQPEGKRRMAAEAFVAGYRPRAGETVGRRV